MEDPYKFIEKKSCFAIPDLKIYKVRMLHFKDAEELADEIISMRNKLDLIFLTHDIDKHKLLKAKNKNI